MVNNFEKELVSVVVPTYNHVHFVDETLLSITSQMYPNLQIIVCDDCSSDGTSEKVKEWASKDKRIIPVLSDKNQGLSININKGLDLVTGEFLSIIGGDDKMKLDKISKQVHFLNKNQEYDVVIHWVDVFDSESGKTLDVINSNILKSPKDWFAPNVSFGISKKANNSIFPPTAYLARSSYALFSRYDYRLKFKNEILFAIDNYVNKPEAKWFCIPEILGCYRMHENNMHRSKEMSNALMEETYVNVALASAKYPFLIPKMKKILQYYLYKELYYLKIQGENNEHIRIKQAKARFKNESNLFRYCYAMLFLYAKLFYRKIRN